MGKNSTLSLYEIVLGKQFNQLPLVFQRMHGTSLPQVAAGEMTITYGKGWLARLCTPFMPIPPKGTYPLTLEICAHRKGEEWIRSFPKHQMKSIQYLENGIFYEQFGFSYFSFELVIIKDKLLFNCQKQYLGGIPIPTSLMIQPYAVAKAIDENSWELTVRITFLGKLLAEYKGKMTIVD